MELRPWEADSLSAGQKISRH